MVSGFNHLHIDAGKIILQNGYSNSHILTHDERAAFNSLRKNNKSIYLTVSATLENQPFEISSILTLCNITGDKSYGSLIWCAGVPIVCALGGDPDEPALVIQFGF